MKRKRKSDQLDNLHTCDLILTDANGRSIHVHKALLMDRSDYFARMLAENNLQVLQLDENYLIELINYLYSHESEDCWRSGQYYQSRSLVDSNEDDCSNQMDSSITDSDIEILMHLLALSKKYEFKQLYRSLITEIYYRLQPSSVLTIYRYAFELDIVELQDSTRLTILSWLPQIQKTESFYNLSEESINHIFTAESPEVDNECKLNALSSWWSHNKESDMTSLWVKLITCNK